MSDIADKADKEIETNLALFLALQLRRGTIVTPENWDGQCTECGGDVMPPARKQLGHVTCIECQKLLEVRR